MITPMKITAAIAATLFILGWILSSAKVSDRNGPMNYHVSHGLMRLGTLGGYAVLIWWFWRWAATP